MNGAGFLGLEDPRRGPAAAGRASIREVGTHVRRHQAPPLLSTLLADRVSRIGTDEALALGARNGGMHGALDFVTPPATSGDNKGSIHEQSLRPSTG
jgi:hypothetical protein